MFSDQEIEGAIDNMSSAYNKFGLFPESAKRYAVSGNRPNFGEIDFAIHSHLGVIYIT